MSYPNLTADRKFKLKSTSTEYTLKPPSLTTTLCSPQPTINFRSKTAFVWCSQRFDTRNRRKLHTACHPNLANHTTHRAKPAKPAHPALCLRIKLRGALPSARCCNPVAHSTNRLVVGVPTLLCASSLNHAQIHFGAA